MQDLPDAQLLRDYAETGNDAAFREIVSRHTDLVYSAALRQVTLVDLAQDISQNVFVDLARKAKEVGERLPANASLVGWLYRSTRFAVLNHLRDDRRRALHERQAMEQLITDCGPAQDWERICPLLDEAMAQLSDEDRDAVLLRYFKNHDFRSVGNALGLSDDAAQKRVSRAVERMREFFSKRGVTIGASGLIMVVSVNAVHAAPLALTTTISMAALLAGTTAHTSTAIAATKAIVMTALQKTIVTVTVVALAGTGIYEAHQSSQLREKVQTLQQEQAPLSAQIQQLQRERDEATNQLAALSEEPGKIKNNDLELLKLRGEVGSLRQQLSQYSDQPGRTITPPASNLPTDLSAQLAAAIIQGDPTALQQLSDFAKSQSEYFRTNSAGLQGDELTSVWNTSFGGIMAAFNSLSDEAAKGNANARRAIQQAAQIGNLQGAAVNALGSLAGKGDEDALETLLNPGKNGLLLSGTIGALRPAAENGNQKAIAALAAVLTDETKKPLWFMASSGLQKAASSGNPIAIAALKSMPPQ